VECESNDLRTRVENVMEMALATMKPLSRAFMGSGVDMMKMETV
jgi:cleavage and polyadenylation specificity factor subunit 3